MDRSDPDFISPRHVLVVGAGPAGLVAAITLARYGMEVLLVDKRPQISMLSRALVISTRSMEILRSWGLEPDVRAGAADVEPCGWLTPTLLSGEGTQMPLGYPTMAEAAKVSPTRPAWTPQDHLEPLLLSRLRSYPTAEARLGTELLSFEQDEGGVSVVLADHASAQVNRMRAAFMIGADGAHSTVRSQLAVRMKGPDNLGEYHSVQFQAQLTRHLKRRYGINVITHPDAAGVLAPRGSHDRWLYAREWQPGQDRLVDLAELPLAHIVASAAGMPDLKVRIERVSTFTFAAQIADRYRDRRAFLVGDAAHQMTPRGGTGMNTAIHDAYDLGWKLAWVLRGWATPELLASYEAERRPVGLHNVERSADPSGARRETHLALAYDLNGRLTHRWLQRGNRTTSTLDLLGDGLTLLTDSHEPRWDHAAAALHSPAPVAIYRLTRAEARDVGIEPGGAILLRPDGRRAASWPAFPVHSTTVLCPKKCPNDHWPRTATTPDPAPRPG